MTPANETFSFPNAIHPDLAFALKAKGYTQLTPVQMEMANGGHGDADLLVSAQTGSGKTVAFGIAIASTLLGNTEKFKAAERPLGLVIAPTRELAIQVQRELDWLYAATYVQTATCVGGMDMRTERRALERGAHLVVGTPGRLRDHINKGTLDLGAIRAIVLDEADEMLDLGFREDLEFILGAAPQERRTLLFSATVPRGIAELARSFQKDAVRIAATASTEQHADIEYQMMLVRRDEREHAVINTLLDSDSASALVFCHTREAVRHLSARLANRGFSVVSLSGEMAQSERSNALQSMRDGRAHVCVATDVAARGIDLPNLDLVIHADVPSNPATLLHRSGRTGRAGRKGICVLIVPENRRVAAQRVLTLAKLSAIVRAAPSFMEIEARYRRQILDTAVSTAEPDEVEAAFVAELLEKASPERIAVVFLRQQLAARPVPEDISPLPVATMQAGKLKRGGRVEDERGSVKAREPRKSDMEGGVWFTLSLGRKQRADPKWLLPMICKAGGVSKRDVGSIRIDDTETRFEIAADRAADFAGQIKRPGAIQPGIVIKPAEGARGSDWQAGPKIGKGRGPENIPGHLDKPLNADRDKVRRHKGKPKHPRLPRS
ncbi:helicase [Mesorhizobium sp. Root554]|uniref:DEAD/DEAH box helicase n=1 Tax=unclassified Mesorhizobium TaxID=325217 RepID=UPI0006FE6C4E|nr:MULTISPECIES: DEAD/DEAH box helicase [unclassified Mesorhizobium]KQZ16087.1 helicase [Mesorhizobium sp. Root1471]KQZ38603.1 helicase [Mesorhizobium sp. Root554]